MRRVAAALSVSLLASVAWGQRPTPARVAALIANFHELATVPDGMRGGYIVDPTIRKEAAPIKVERAYTSALNDLAASEVTRSVAESQRKAAAAREQSRQDDVVRAQLARDAAGQLLQRIEETDPADDPAKSVSIQHAKEGLDHANAALKTAQFQLNAAKVESAAAEENALEANSAFGAASNAEVKARNARRASLPQALQNFCSAEGLAIQRNTILVRFADSASLSEISTILQRHDVSVVGGIPEVSLFVVHLDPASGPETDDEHWARLARTAGDLGGERPQVISAVLQTLLYPTANCSGSGSVVMHPCWEWQTANDSGVRSAALIRLPAATDFLNTNRKNGGASVPVAVIDPEFTANADIPSITAVCNGCSHGTQVAGMLIGASGTNHVPNGALPIINFIEVPAPIIPLGCQSDSAVAFIRIIVALRDLIAAQRARIVNFSLGYNWSDYDGVPASMRPDIQALVAAQGSIVRDLLTQFSDKVVVVAAAGNDADVPTFGSPVTWAALGPAVGPATPACPNIIIVAASDCTGALTSTSDLRAPEVVLAPGEDLLTCVDGMNAVTANGTSLSAPIVSGIAAMMLAQNPDLTPTQVVSILKQSQTSMTVDALSAVQLAKTPP